MKVIYKVHGYDGHRQAQAFGTSEFWNFSTPEKRREISIIRQDITGTTDWVIVEIDADTYQDCVKEMCGQISDGIFENCRYGDVELYVRESGKWERLAL